MRWSTSFADRFYCISRFPVQVTGTLVITDLTFTVDSDYGGAVLVNPGGVLRTQGAVFSGCSATVNGGAILNRGIAIFSKTEFRGGFAAGLGGQIYNTGNIMWNGGVMEGGGATGLAGILPGGPLHERVQGKKVVVPLCGGNIDTTTLGRVIERGLAADERLVRFVAQVSDLPGGVANLTKLLADHGASIKDIYHERAWLHTSVAKVQVKCVIETIDKDHAEKVRQALCEKCKSERSKNETSRLRCCWRSCFFRGRWPVPAVTNSALTDPVCAFTALSTMRPLHT